MLLIYRKMKTTDLSKFNRNVHVWKYQHKKKAGLIIRFKVEKRLRQNSFIFADNISKTKLTVAAVRSFYCPGNADNTKKHRKSHFEARESFHPLKTATSHRIRNSLSCLEYKEMIFKLIYNHDKRVNKQ